MAQELKTDSVYHEFWLLRSSGNSLQWTKPPESLKYGKPVGPGGGKEPWPKLMQEMAVKWWESSGQYSTPEEADAGSRKRVISPLRAANWAGVLSAFSLPYLAYRTMMGGFAPRGKSERWKHEEEGKPGLLGTTQEFCRPQVRWRLFLPCSPATLRLTLISSQALLTPSLAPILFPRESHYIGGGKEHCRRKIQGSLYHCLPEKWAKVLICSGYHLCFNRGSIDTISYPSQIPRILEILGLLVEGHSVLWQDVLVRANAHIDFFSFVVVQLGVCVTWRRQHRPVTHSALLRWLEVWELKHPLLLIIWWIREVIYLWRLLSLQ